MSESEHNQICERLDRIIELLQDLPREQQGQVMVTVDDKTLLMPACRYEIIIHVDGAEFEYVVQQVEKIKTLPHNVSISVNQSVDCTGHTSSEHVSPYIEVIVSKVTRGAGGV